MHKVVYYSLVSFVPYLIVLFVFLFHDKLFYNLNTTGAVLSPFDSYLLIRGLKTLSIRMERSTENARKVVEFLKTSPQVKEVLYTGKGGMVSFKIQDEKKIPNLLNSLLVFTFAGMSAWVWVVG